MFHYENCHFLNWNNSSQLVTKMCDTKIKEKSWNLQQQQSEQKKPKEHNIFCKQWKENQYQNSSWKWNLFISFDQLDYRFTKVGINCWSIHWTTTNKLSYLLVHTVVTSWPSHDFYNELKSLLDSISSLTFLWCIGNQREHK